MTKQINIGDRVALTANMVKFVYNDKHQAAKLRGEVIAIICYGHLAVVQWDGVADEQSNATYSINGICKPKSVAFSEVKYGNADHGRGL